MFSSSPKWLTINTNKQVLNYVTIGNSGNLPNDHPYSPKGQSKNQQNLFKYNYLSRYSSQEDLKSYAKSNLSAQQFDNSPKSQQDIMSKKHNFFSPKSNVMADKGVLNFRSNQNKKKSSIIAGEHNFSYFKNIVNQHKGIKHLKQTSSTSSTEYVGQEPKSLKTIPSFLKNSGNIKKKLQQLNHQKQESFLFHSNKMFGELSIDKFEIIDKLGEGKFGNVFSAVQKSTGFLVALKIVEKRKIIQQNFLTQFIRQIKIQAYLQHPNIAKVYGFFDDAQYFYSILQLGEGGQLYDIVKNGQVLSEESTSFIIGNLLDAIQYLHEKKILHRDIKPENIVLVHGNVKLCDFGWAVYKKQELRSTFCGTPLYLSPQLLNGQKYDEKVDLWAIGILAFQLHIGSSPFNIQTQDDLLKILTSDIQYPQNCYASKNFKQFIEAVLKKDPKQRLEAKKLMQLKFIKRYRELQTCQQLCQ